MKKTRVWIVDDHMVVRGGIRQIAAATEDLAVVGESADGAGALDAARRRQIDVMLLDLSMPGGGIELVPRLLQVQPALRILVLTMHGEPQMAARAAKAGAKGYITKDADARMLLKAVRTVAAGGTFMEPRLADALLFERIDDREPTPDVLTRRELEVLERIASGQSLTEIAAQLDCSAKTISVHKHRLMQKLKVINNIELFNYAMRHCLGRA